VPPATRLCSLLGIRLPIVGAGTGSIATARLAAAVTNAGGLGMTGAAGDPPQQVIERVREIRTLTDGPTGVNVILELQPPEAIAAILEEGIEVLATGFGEPDEVIRLAHEAGTRVFHRCETAEDARRAVEAGADGVIAQGADSGGHTGRIPTFTLVPQVADAAGGLPVLAAGGVADGRALVAALALGADGVLLGTRLVASVESGAHEIYKQGIVEAAAEDSIVTDIFEIGWPGRPERVLRNATTEAWRREPEPRVRPSDRPIEIIARRQLADGELELPRWFVDTPNAGDEGAVGEMALYAGPAAGLIDEVLPAAEIVRRLAAEADEAWATLAARMVGSP
jgi:NAD(P)H-dependent flavin oxidoreductase YrpB (nitropropane dioxygenase family)